MHGPSQSLPSVRETLGDVIAVDEAQRGALSDEEGDAGVEGADEEVNCEVVVEVLSRPELCEGTKKSASVIRVDGSAPLTIQKQ